MSAAGKIDDGGFSLVSEPSKVHGGFTAGPSNDDTGGFALVSEPYNLGDRLGAGIKEGVGNVVDTGKEMAQAGEDQLRDIWSAPLDQGHAAPGPLYSLETIGKGGEEVFDVAMRAMQSGFQVPAAMLRAESKSLSERVHPAAGFPAGAAGEVMGAVPEGFIGEGGIPHVAEGPHAPLKEVAAESPAPPAGTAPARRPVPAPPPRPAALDALQTPAEAPARDIMSAGTVDDAIAKAGAAIDHPALNVQAMGAEARRQAEEADAQEPAQEPEAAPQTIGRVRGLARARPEGPSDVASFLSARGGIRNDEGHDLVAGRGLQQFVPGVGPLIRPGGMSVDYAGEALHEAGFFGPPEATEDQVLQLLEQTGRGPDGKPTKVYAPEDQANGAQAKRAADLVQEENDAALADVHGLSRQMGETLTDDEAHQILSEMGAHGLDLESALVEHLERQAVREDYSDHEGFTDPETEAEPVPFPEGGVDRAAGEVFDEPQPIAGDQGVAGEAGPADAPHPGEALTDVKPYEPPALKPHEGSWVIVERATGKPVTELFKDSQAIDHLDGETYQAVPAGEYLGELNRRIKENGGTQPPDQPFRDERALSTERGAEGFDQTIIPGGEQSARQLAQARESQGHGRATTTARQKPPDEGLFGEGPDDEPTMFSKREDDIAPPFFSALTRGVEGLKMEKATPGQWEATIKNMPGVKAEELDWSGVNDWLRGQTRSVTKAEMLDHLRHNEVQVQDVEKSDRSNRTHEMPSEERARQIADSHGRDWSSMESMERQSYFDEVAKERNAPGTKFGSYVLPGGENYRELLLTLPSEKARLSDKLNGHGLTPQELRRYSEIGSTQDFRSSHFDEPNILAHVRFDDRTGLNGEKVLHVAEVQSDWHQAGRRKGYKTEDVPTLRDNLQVHEISIREGEHDWTGTSPDGRTAKVGKGVEASEAGARDYIRRYLNVQAVENNRAAAIADARQVPDGPFKTSWHELAMKRMLRYAAEHGYDRVSWDTGDTNADRYDLSKKISRVHIDDNSSGGIGRSSMEGPTDRGTITAYDHAGKKVIDRPFYDPKDLPDIIGKDLADKLLNSTPKEVRDAGLGMRRRELSGLDLKVGGDGMRGFYDKILPNTVNKLAKKWGAKVETYDVKKSHGAWEAVSPNGHEVRVVRTFGEKTTLEKQGWAVHERPSLSDTIPAHSISITPAMRESVMQGQPLFQKGEGGDGKAPTRIRAGYSEEFAAQRDAVAADARKRLDALGLHDIGVKVADWIKAEHPDGNFAVNGLFRGAEKIIALALDSTNGLSTLDHEAIHAFRGLGLFKKSEWSMLANRATREWREKFDIDRRYAGRSEDKLNEEAIAEAFRHWVADPGTQKGLFARLFDRVRNTLAAIGNAVRGRGFATPESIFRKADAGKIGARPRKPGNASSVPAYAVRNAEQAEKETGPGEEPRGSWRGHIPDMIQEKAAPVLDVWHNLQMLASPMAVGSDTARAVAKDFANVMRLARWQGGKMDEFLQKHFNRAQQTRMWQAADAESVAVQRGENEAPAAGLSSLSDEERGVVERLQADAKAAFNAAKAQGMVEGEGLPSYAPRMIVEITRDGARPVGSTGAPASIPGLGRNLRTTTGNLRERKYLTTEETAAAATAKFGANAQVVQNIRTLPLATARLNEAVAGRAMINKIKAIGQSTGQETVVEGSIPEGEEHSWFTVDHPAFKTWRPRFETDKETGKTVPMKDAAGEPIFEKVPIYVRSDFEGPLKAVLSEKSGAVYTGLMTLKGRVMSMIMYSPLIHNAVEWGRALPAMPGKVASFKIYFEGNAAKNDHATMSEAINAGLVPIGHRYGFQDITSIAEEPNIAPGRSWTAKLLGAIPNLFDERAGDAVKSAVDKMGDIWHNTLLWDRVADLQMGLYTNFRQELIKEGNDPQTAQRIAAHFANRYAGALPLESMSAASRKAANLILFSRTFTLGNLGAMKDAFLGLPKDIQAQIARDAGTASLKAGKSMARRRAAAVIALDIGFFYAGNSLLQSALNVMRGQNSGSEEEQGYLDRLHAAMGRIEENPLELLSPFQIAQSLSATAENEPGKEDRIRVGTNDDGTAIYARNPAGKMGEEFHGWLTDPLDMIKRKLGTMAAPTLQLIANDKGFGRQVYDPNASSIGSALRNLGSIAMLYIGSQFPVDSAQAVVDMASGRETKANAFKAAGPLAGATFSKGAPGGPAVGVLYAEKERQRFETQQEMPAIRQMIKDGQIEPAVAEMQKLGMSRGLIAYYVRTTENPQTRISRGALRDFYMSATPEETARMEAAQAQAQH